MKKSSFVIYVGYVWIKTLIGLVFHPYRSVIETMRHPVLFPVIFSPCIGLLFLFIISKISSLLLEIYGFQREIIALILSTTLISMVCWQMLLFFLLGSFLTSSWKNK